MKMNMDTGMKSADTTTKMTKKTKSTMKKSM
jgi:hypothetical protein